MSKKTIFVTGATGNMGWATFLELLKKNKYYIKILARQSSKNESMLKPYLKRDDVKIIWGDLLNLSDVSKGVENSDYVLHIGGMVSPAADYFPEKTLQTNTTAAQNIVHAIHEQKREEDIKLVYVGSVAEYGNRMGKILWGRCGDPLRASKYDKYAVSKVLAEEIIVNSGVKHWVSLRQTGILYPGILRVVNPTAFHVPVRGVLEWATVEDSGRLMANLCEDWVKDSFWNKFYNISSGEDYRMSNYEFETRLLGALGLPGPEKIFEPQWFATRNFHGMWYTDSNKLQSAVPFRDNTSSEDYFKQMKSKLPWFYSLAFLAPAWAAKMAMKPYAFEAGMGTQDWIKNDEERFKAYYGSLEEYEQIKSWSQIRPGYMEKNLKKAVSNKEVNILNHGWDETKDIYSLSDEELRIVAEFRGGKYLGLDENGKYVWECEHGHRFSSNLEYILLGGGWCTICPVDDPETYATEKNQFVQQIL